MLQWKMLHPRMTMEMLGLLPDFISEFNHEPAAKQIATNYAHGGGWNPLREWKLVNLDKHLIQYPGDPPMIPRAQTQLRDETIVYYDHAIVAIFQKDGTFEAARVD